MRAPVEVLATTSLAAWRARYLASAGLIAIAAITMPLGTTVVRAQEVAAAENNDDQSENAIFVTAQRRNERLEDVPMTVTALSEETLTAAGVTAVRDLANVTTGFQLGQGGAFPQPAIRGITTIINGTFENNVAVYVDGLYQTVPATLNIDLPNVEGVQVLKGPQGTLYGRNATGGAILITTITPSDTWRGKAEFTYAKYDDKRVSAYVAGPLSDMIGMSIAGYIRRGDGYNKLASRTVPGATDGKATPVEQDMLRVKLRADLTNALSATLAYNFVRADDARSNYYSPLENVNPNPYGIRPGGATRPMRLGVAAYDPAAIQATKQHEGSLTINWDSGLGTLRSITGYSQVVTTNGVDFDGTYIRQQYSNSQQRQRTFQQALDFTVTAIDNLDLIVGGTYFVDKHNFPGPANAYSGTDLNNPGITPASLASDFILLQSGFFTQKKTAWGLYADATYTLTDRLSVNVGGRYSQEKQEPTGLVTSSVNPAAVRPLTRASHTFSRFTPRASIRYEVADRTNVYFAYSQGFRSGAYNNVIPACAITTPSCWTPINQETITSYEVGFKTAGRGYRLELAAFRYDYKNLQVAATRNIGGITVVDIANAPSAKIHGIEGSFEVEPVDNFTVRGGATWLRARFGDNFFFQGTGVVNTGVIGINTNSDPLKTYLNQSQLQDLSGLTMSRAPEWSANLGADYLIPIGEGGVRFAANLKYTSRYVVTNPSVWGTGAGVPVDRQREQRFVEGAFALLNASVTWTDPTDTYSIRVWGTNLTDHRYRLHYTGTGSGTYSPMAEPRIYGATVGYKF